MELDTPWSNRNRRQTTSSASPDCQRSALLAALSDGPFASAGNEYENKTAMESQQQETASAISRLGAFSAPPSHGYASVIEGLTARDFHQEVRQREPCSSSCQLVEHGFPPEAPVAPSQSVIGPLEDQKVVAAKLYTPIKPWQTRLLCLQPGEYGDELHAQLLVANIMEGDGLVLKDRDERVEYLALSYYWGPRSFRRPLNVSKHDYPIPENLFCALQRVRSWSQALYIWVDAVCINQHDVDERSLQVRTMLSKFQKARQVSVWLGECCGPSATAAGSLMSHGDDGLRRQIEACCSAHAQDLVKGVVELLERPWFRRIWIRQEVWASQSLVVQCGGARLSWNLLKALPSFIPVLGARQ